MHKWIIGIVFLAAAAVGIFYFSGNAEEKGGVSVPAEAEKFDQEGNLTLNNPGMEKDIWYLVYEKPGQLALSMKLQFSPSSICAKGVENSTCRPETLQIGSRARVTGEIAGGQTVRVIRLELK